MKDSGTISPDTPEACRDLMVEAAYGGHAGSGRAERFVMLRRGPVPYASPHDLFHLKASTDHGITEVQKNLRQNRRLVFRME